MKKIIAVFGLFLILATISLPVFAAAQVSLTPSSGTAHRGDEVAVTINVSGAGNHKQGGVYVDYDINVLELVSGEWLINGTDMAYFTPSMKDGAFAYSSAAKEIAGSVFRLYFKVKSGAALSSTKVTATLILSGQNYPVTTSITVACKHSFSSWSKADGSNHTRKCSTCGTVETKAHTFDNGCDNACNDCGATRSTTHNYKTEWSSTAEYHFHACSICGDWKDTAEHTPGDPATEEAPQICTVCERVLVETLEHVHELDSNIQSDETGHWYNCAKCEEKAEFAEHIYLFDCDALCDACGYARETEATHTPGEEWISDETGHWHVCAVCQEKTDESAHTGDVNVAEPKCDICAHEMPHEHLYAEQWSSHAGEHWHECVCGDKQDTQSHTWDEGVVTEAPYREKQGVMTYTCTVCGELDTAIIIETSRDLIPWWIACGALSVLLLGTTVTLIVIVVKVKKKATGKYAVQ